MCFGPEKYTPGEWFWAHAAQSSVVAFETYDPRTDYCSGTEIGKQFLLPISNFCATAIVSTWVVCLKRYNRGLSSICQKQS